MRTPAGLEWHLLKRRSVRAGPTGRRKFGPSAALQSPHPSHYAIVCPGRILVGKNPAQLPARPAKQGTSPSTVSERRMTGLNTHAADLESVVEANRPLEEEPREGRPARILDECGQGPELRGLARQLVQCHGSEDGPRKVCVERLRRSSSFRRAEQRVGFVVDRPVPGQAICLLYTSPSPRDKRQSRMPSSA